MFGQFAAGILYQLGFGVLYRCQLLGGFLFLAAGFGQGGFGLAAQFGYGQAFLLQFLEQAVGAEVGRFQVGAGGGDDGVGQAEAGGDGQGVAASGDAVGEVVGGFQAAGVEVNAWR